MLTDLLGARVKDTNGYVSKGLGVPAVEGKVRAVWGAEVVRLVVQLDSGQLVEGPASWWSVV